MLIELVGGPEDGAVRMVPDQIINEVVLEQHTPTIVIRYIYQDTQTLRDNGTRIFQLARTAQITGD